MSLKRNEEQITENQLFATYNLEIPGSSPDWSTIKINGLRKIFVSRFYFNYITSQARRTALFTKILREIRCISTLQKECKSNATGS